MSNEHDKNVVYGDGFHDGYLKGRAEGWDAAIKEAYADGNKSVPLYRHPPTSAVLELVRVQREALEHLRDDLLMRSDESDSDGTKIVNCGRGVWCELNDALAKYNDVMGDNNEHE